MKSIYSEKRASRRCLILCLLICFMLVMTVGAQGSSPRTDTPDSDGPGSQYTGQSTFIAYLEKLIDQWYGKEITNSGNAVTQIIVLIPEIQGPDPHENIIGQNYLAFALDKYGPMLTREQEQALHNAIVNSLTPEQMNSFVNSLQTAMGGQGGLINLNN